jgi:hypothetical protein
MENLELVRVINKDQKYKDKNGVERVNENFYVVFNGSYIAIKPCFKEGYSKLSLISNTIINGK